MGAGMRATVLLVMFLANLALFGQCYANPYIEPEPQRIASVAEVESVLADPSQTGAMRTSVLLRRLWDGHRDMLLKAVRSDNTWLHSAAILGLVGIGDKEAISSLTDVVEDTSAPFGSRFTAVQALGRLGAFSELDAMRAFRASIDERGRVYTDAVDRAIEMAERPDLAMPLIVRGSSFLEFRFFLEDIATAYVFRDGLHFVNGGVIYSPNPNGPKNREEIPEAEYARVCELLQDGVFEVPGMIAEGEYLVFELTDGRHVAVGRSGDYFFTHDSLTGSLGAPWLCVKCPELAEYIDELWEASTKDRMRASESPN